MKTKKQREIPRGLKYVDLPRHLRRLSVYDEVKHQKKLYSAAEALARRIIQRRKQKVKQPVPEPRQSLYYTNEAVWGYWEKQIHVVELFEQRFENTVVQFLTQLEEKVVAELRQPKSVRTVVRKTKQLFNDDEMIRAGINLFDPLMQELLQVAGEEAYRLLDKEAGYVPSKKAKELITAKVKLFTGSMLATDRQKLIDVLNNGIREGLGIPEIERNLRSVFTDLKKIQTERIARSEILRTSNLGALDAFEISGVVEAKQWLTAPGACDYCQPMNGKIVKLGRAFFKKGDTWVGDASTPIKLDYDDTLAPPLHVSCRCVIIPVLKEIKGLELAQAKTENEELQKRLEQVESYSKELEKILEIDDDR